MFAWLDEFSLTHVNDNSVIACVRGSSDLGDLGSASLNIDRSITPRVLPCRRIPVALADKVKTELSAFVDKGIIAPVDEPTTWVHQMAVVEKPNEKLRICIDLLCVSVLMYTQLLNVSLKREHYRKPVLDDILPELRKAHVFSKLDVKHAFWHVKPDDESSKLTTMITPYGRYRWNRPPFGLKVSSEIFQNASTQLCQT